ncbi:hypothetical protein PG988_000932 [Apiospora saccharicola]
MGKKKQARQRDAQGRFIKTERDPISIPLPESDEPGVPNPAESAKTNKNAGQAPANNPAQPQTTEDQPELPTLSSAGRVLPFPSRELRLDRPWKNLFTSSVHAESRIENPALPYEWHEDEHRNGSNLPADKVSSESREEATTKTPSTPIRASISDQPESNSHIPSHLIFTQRRSSENAFQHYRNPQPFVSTESTSPSRYSRPSYREPSPSVELPRTRTPEVFPTPTLLRSGIMTDTAGPSSRKEANPRMDMGQDARGFQTHQQIPGLQQSMPSNMESQKDKGKQKETSIRSDSLNGHLITELPYTTSEWLLDAAILMELKDEMSLGEYGHLTYVTDLSLWNAAGQALTTCDQTTRMSLITPALARIPRIAGDHAKFTRFTERFRKGPNVKSPPKVARRSPNQEARYSPYTSPTRRSHQDRREESHPPPAPPIPSNTYRPSSTIRTLATPSGGTTPTMAMLNLDTVTTLPIRKEPTKPMASPQLSHSTQTYVRTFKRTDKRLTDQFINRIDHYENAAGTRAVLDHLNIGILLKPESEGCKWFDSTSAEEKERMMNDLQTWRDLLTDRFRKDRGDMLREADKLRHDFGQEDQLSLNGYFDKRVNLYREANEVDEDSMVRRIHAGLDPILKQRIQLRRDPSNNLADFRKEIAETEHDAREEWERQDKQRKASDKRIEELEAKLRTDTSKTRRQQQAINLTPSVARTLKTLATDGAFQRQPLSERKDTDQVKTEDTSEDKKPWFNKQNNGRSQDRPWRRNNGWKSRNDNWDNRKNNNWNNGRNDSSKAVSAYSIEGQLLVQDPDGGGMFQIPENVIDQLNDLRDEEEGVDDATVTDETTETLTPVIEEPKEADERTTEGVPEVVDDILEKIEIRAGFNPHIPKYVHTKLTHSLVTENQTYEWESTSHLRTVVHTPGGPTEAYLDTCSPPSLITPSILAAKFPDVVPTKLHQPFQLNGIGTGPSIHQSCRVPISLLDTNKQPFQVEETVFIVDKLSCGFLLGVNFLKKNLLHIQWGGPKQNDRLRIADSDRYIWATDTQSPRRKSFNQRVKATIRAAKTLCIKPGHGMNVPVTHHELPTTCHGYLVDPVAKSDPGKLSYGSLIKGIMDGQTNNIPFANFGKVPMTIHKGEVLGHLNKIEVTRSVDSFLAAPESNLAIPLEDLIGEIPAEDSEDDDRYAHGYPFHLPNPSEEAKQLDLSKANIPDCWGPEIRTAIENIIRKNAHLFRPELDKCHFAQPGLKALGHHVSRLGLSTLDEKVEAISKLAMPRNLQELESGLGLMGYYRSFIHNFAILSAPLQDLKSLGFKGAPPKNPARETHARKFSFPPTPPALPPEPTPEQVAERENLCNEYSKLWEDARRAWKILKRKLTATVDLAFPDYARPFILRVDSSRQVGVGAALYQEQPDGKIRPVLFLSRVYSDTESRYPACELETLGLVWALKKLTHYLDHSDIAVMTDHEAIAKAFAAKPQMPRGTYRLVNWRLFLARYAHRIKILHAPGKTMQDVDALSRLPLQTVEEASEEDKITIPETETPSARQTPPVSSFVSSFVVTRSKAKIATEDPVQNVPVEVSEYPPARDLDKSSPPVRPQDTQLPEITDKATPEDSTEEPPADAEVVLGDIEGQTYFRLQIAERMISDIVKSLPKDRTFKAIYERLLTQVKDTKNDADGPLLYLHFFRLDPVTKLLYFTEGGRDRLAIPAELRRRIVKLVHDDRTHVGSSRTYDYLKNIAYFPKMRGYVDDYCKQCPNCKFAEPTRKLPFGDLQPIISPKTPLSVLSMDFIVGLPISRSGNDAILIIVCKLTKFVFAIIGRSDWDTEQWAREYIKYIYTIVGFPDAFISDMDPKFVSKFWACLCKAANIEVKMTAAHHQSANGQAERVIQTIKLGLRAIMGARLNFDDWENFLSHVIYCHNTSTSATTKQCPYMTLFGRLPKSFLPVDATLPEPWVKAQQTLHQEALEATALAQTRMKMYYDDKHRKPPTIKEGDLVFVKLAKSGDSHGYHLDNQTPLSYRRTGPFKVLKCLSNLKYRIDLPTWLKWNKDISIEHLEPFGTDKFERPIPSPGPMTQDGIDKYIISNIHEHANMRREGDRKERRYYRVSWLGYDETTWEPESELQKDVPQLLKKYHRERDTTQARKTTVSTSSTS